MIVVVIEVRLPRVVLAPHRNPVELWKRLMMLHVHIMPHHHSLDGTDEPFGPPGIRRVTTWSWQALFQCFGDTGGRLLVVVVEVVDHQMLMALHTWIYTTEVMLSPEGSRLYTPSSFSPDSSGPDAISTAGSRLESG